LSLAEEGGSVHGGGLHHDHALEAVRPPDTGDGHEVRRRARHRFH
jgi:hypothetical protein